MKADRNEALLIVNVQNGFLNTHTKHLPPRIEFISIWFDTVIVHQYFNCVQSDDKTLISSITDWSSISPGSIEYETAFDIPKGATIISGSDYRIVTEDLLEYLRKECIGHVHLTGMDTDISIQAGACELLRAGLDVTVHGDYCASTLGPWQHRRALQRLPVMPVPDTTHGRPIGHRMTLGSNENRNNNDGR